jgi:hypothetical protein
MKQSHCTNHSTPTNRPRASDLERLNKPHASRPSQRNWQTGGTSCCKRGGSVFLTVFKPVHALLLSSLRFLGPRNSRGEGAKQPRNFIDSWPQTRQFPERGQAQYRARTQTICVHEQSASVSSPRPQARQQTVRIREHATPSTVRKQAFAWNGRYPQAVRRLELSVSATSSLTGIVREPRQSENHPCRCIAVSVSPLTNVPVHIRIIPAYVYI